MNEIWLNVGFRTFSISGFITIDLMKDKYQAAIDKLIRMPEASVAGIYCDQLIEHLSQSDALSLLRAFRRVLVNEGVLRIATIDLDKIVQDYQDDKMTDPNVNEEIVNDRTINRCDALNEVLSGGQYKKIYNEDALSILGQQAGFTPISRYDYGMSSTNQLTDLERLQISTLIMEFERPDRRLTDQPLVSVIIPAFKHAYYQTALQSVLEQTYKNIEIIIGDDSPGDEIKTITDKNTVVGRKVHYIRNSPPLGDYGRSNHIKCFTLARGEFIKFLNDDDLLAPNCIEMMVNTFKTNPDVVLVTSRRIRINESGQTMSDIPATQPLFDYDVEIEGISCANALCVFHNFIGEPSTVMFRKSDLAWVKPHFFKIGGVVPVGMGDVAMWLNLLGRGNVYYLANPLSYFRVHNSQNQNNQEIRKKRALARKVVLYHGRRLGLMPHRIVWYLKYRRSDSVGWEFRYLFSFKLFYLQFRKYLRFMVRWLFRLPSTNDGIGEIL